MERRTPCRHGHRWLARLKTEVLDYKPDLIIWDYGFVDLTAGKNPKGGSAHTFISVRQPVLYLLAWFIHLTRNVLGTTVTYMKLTDYVIKKNLDRNLRA